MIANPHAGRNDGVIQALSDRNPTVSQSTMNDVIAGTHTITVKDLLEAEMASLNLNSSLAYNQLLNFYALDTNSWSQDSVLSLLQNHHSVSSVIALVDYRLQQGDLENASDMLNNLSYFWWTEAEIAMANDMRAMINILGNDSTQSFSFGALEAKTLDSLFILGQNTQSSYIARRIDAILQPYGLGDAHYLEPVILPSQFKSESKKITRREKPISTFTIYPNPTSGRLVVQWKWLEEGIDGEITCNIRSLNGQIVMKTAIADFMKNIHVFDVSNLSNGMYIVELTSQNGRVFHNDKLSVVK